MEKELLQHYHQTSDGTYLIEFNINSLDDFFSEYDPFPHEERDLNPKLVETMLKQIVVFPKKEKVKIVFHLPKRFKKQRLETSFIKALKHHLEFDYLDSNLHLARRLHKGRRTLIAALTIFIILIAASTLIHNFLPSKVIWNILSEGFFVGAWVSLWHPIETLLYEWLPLHEEKLKVERLLAMSVEFIYK